jgi:myo-inositol-1(or 4)-monophosphatase
MRESAELGRRFLTEVPQLIRGAGEITRRYFRTRDLSVDYKSDRSPVTEADRETERFLRKEIAARFPGHTVVGEELGGTVDPAGGPTWIVDPIDGTKAFVHGVPLYTVLIALVQDGAFLGGAVHNPILGETVVAASGHGCFLNGEPSRVRADRSLGEATLCATDFADLYRRAPLFTASILSEAGMARTWADGYAYLLLAAGRIDAALDPIMNLWDVAAVVPVVREAGGVITQWDGNMTPSPDSAIAATPQLHAELLERTGGVDADTGV